jgi:hypothetical protein
MESLSADYDLACSPIDLVQLKGHYLTCTKTESGEQEQNGVIPPAGAGATVACSEQALDIFRREMLRDRG